MVRWRWVWMPLVAAGCKPAPPNLLERFEGSWIGDLVAVTGERRGLDAELLLDLDTEDLIGEISIEDTDATRAYGVQSSQSIDSLGIALYFVELAGVRELWTEAEPPADGFWTGPYRTTWACSPGDPDDPDGDGLCGHEGTLQLSSR